jgi:hypothetical protein
MLNEASKKETDPARIMQKELLGAQLRKAFKKKIKDAEEVDSDVSNQSALD